MWYLYLLLLLTGQPTTSRQTPLPRTGTRIESYENGSSKRSVTIIFYFAASRSFCFLGPTPFGTRSPRTTDSPTPPSGSPPSTEFRRPRTTDSRLPRTTDSRPPRTTDSRPPKTTDSRSTPSDLRHPRPATTRVPSGKSVVRRRILSRTRGLFSVGSPPSSPRTPSTDSRPPPSGPRPAATRVPSGKSVVRRRILSRTRGLFFSRTAPVHHPSPDEYRLAAFRYATSLAAIGIPPL